MKKVLRYEYNREGVQEVFPEHQMVNNWVFKEDEKEEAVLANSMAVVAEKYGLGVNDIRSLFPAVLRMLKSDIEWSK